LAMTTSSDKVAQPESQNLLGYVSRAPSFLLIGKAFQLPSTCHQFGELLLPPAIPINCIH